MSMWIHTIYVDFDGVLADFDGAMLENFGVGKESMLTAERRWALINDYERNNSVRINPEWFGDLELMPDSVDLMRFLCKLRDDSEGSMRLVGLTATGNDFWRHAFQKRRWAHEGIFEDFPFDEVITVPKAEVKQFYADPNAILIDDNWERCVKPFIERGGRGILHLNARLTIRKIQFILDGNFRFAPPTEIAP
jgi:5'(3')-deoxyribonucleotidase